MGGFAGIVRGGLAGLNEASGNPGVAAKLEARNEEERGNRIKVALAPLSQALQADQTRLALYADPNDPSRAVAGKEREYQQTLNNMTNTIAQMRSVLGQKPPHKNLLDELHIRRDLQGRIAGYDAQSRNMASEYAQGAIPFALTPQGQQAEFTRQTQEELERQRGQVEEAVAKLRAAGNVTTEKLDAAARNLGFASFADAPPQGQMQAIRDLGAASRAPQKPTYQWDASGQLVAIRSNPDNTISTQPVLAPNGQPVSKYNPVRVSKKSGFYTFTDAQGNVVQVPVSTETESFFEPMAGEPNTASPKTTPKHPSSSKGPTSSSGAGRVIGNKGSPLLKSDEQQYTKAAEDAQIKQRSYQQAQGLLADNSRVTDLELIFSWVRANVQGAGRLTNTEIQQAGKAGSYGTRIQNAMDIASTGRLSPQLEQQFLSDIQRSYQVSQQQADSLRQQVQEEMQPTGPVYQKNKAAQQASALPESAKKQLKEGQITTFANGQQWTLENGQPKQVK